jgi:gamma-glutamylcyclotransferase (GGCT)/AIG2-like uncharacterized protein YtfP
VAWQQAPDQVAEEPPSVVPFFAYGTFRPEASSFFRIAPLVVGEAVPAAVQGRLVMAAAGKWPLLLPGDGENEVRGEVLPLRADRHLWEVLGGWEVAWGYSLRWLPTVRGPAGRVLACVWEWRDNLGHPIRSGDWLSAEQAPPA